MTQKDPLFRTHIQQTIMDYVYGPAKAKLNSKLNSIAQAHGNTDVNGAQAFLYKGMQYAIEGYRPVKRVGLLHRSLYEHMEAYKGEMLALVKEQLEVGSYLSCVLLKAHTAGDLFPLTPDCVHPALHKVFSFKADPSLSQEEIDHMNQLNAKPIGLIKKRLLLNMIT